MKKPPVKAYPTLGCCGLDCGLCPRYYTVGTSRCPGCCGPGFFDKHPSCSYITCCVNKKKLEVCAQCDEFPCSKFEPWLVEGVKYDSFLTYQKVKSNLNFIRNQGLQPFIEQQSRRIRLLQTMIRNFDDGRSRSFYCISAALLSIEDLETALYKTPRRVEVDQKRSDDTEKGSRILKEFLNDLAVKGRVELKLRKKAKTGG